MNQTSCTPLLPCTGTHPALQAANLDAYLGDIGIIFALDWFLDRCRSIPNVLGDAVTAAIVQSKCSEQAELLQRDTQNDTLHEMLLSTDITSDVSM